MRAARLVQIGKPLEEVDIPIPEIGPSDVLIRVAAAGICHSDAHYRAGISKIDPLPLTLGHEVAGRVEEVGGDVTHLSAGDRVCVHYLITCGSCEFCVRGLEQFCRTGQMIIEINPAKLASATSIGAFAIDARSVDPVEQIKEATAGKGVDVALELIGSAKTMQQAVLCLRPLGRAALVGLTAESMSIRPYIELINKEAEIIGVSDHLATELPTLIEFAHSGKLRFPPETLRVVDLDAVQINGALDALQSSIDYVRTVIKVTNEV